MPEVDVDEVVRHEVAVDDHAGRDAHRASPPRHVAVVEVAYLGVLEGAPAAEQHTPAADFFVARKGLVEEVEQVVVQRHHALHELHIAHEARVVVGEELDRRGGADAAGVERRGMHVTSLHEAEHLARPPADLQRLAVELT